MHTHPSSRLHVSNLRGLGGQDIGVTSIDDGERAASEEFTTAQFISLPSPAKNCGVGTYQAVPNSIFTWQVHVSKLRLTRLKPSKVLSRSKDFFAGLACTNAAVALETMRKQRLVFGLRKALLSRYHGLSVARFAGSYIVACGEIVSIVRFRVES